MPKMMERLIIVVLMAMVGLVADAEARSYEDGTVVGTLQNGMGYVIHHNESVKNRVSISLNVNVGAIDCDSICNGIAHLTEHIVNEFGSNKALKDKFNRFLIRNGVTTRASNAETGYEQTAYTISHLHAIDSSVDSALIYLRDMVFNLKVDEPAIDDCRRVILAEVMDRASQNDISLRECVDSDSPYHTSSILGSKNTLSRIDEKRVLKFYHDNYYPENTYLYIVGDVSPASVQASLEHVMGAVSPTQKTGRAREFHTIKTSPTVFKSATAEHPKLVFTFPELEGDSQDALIFALEAIKMGAQVTTPSRRFKVVVENSLPSADFHYNIVSFALENQDDITEFKPIITFVKRLGVRGLTLSQYERYKQLIEYQLAYNDRIFAEMSHSEIIDWLNIHPGEYATVAEQSKSLARLLSMSLTDLNELLRFDLDNATLVIPSDGNVETAEDLRDAWNDVSFELDNQVEAQSQLVGQVIDKESVELIAAASEDVEIIGNQAVAHMSYHNGAEVYVVNDDKTIGRVTLTIFTPVGSFDLVDNFGGTSLYAQFLASTYPVFGRGEISNVELDSYKSDKQINIGCSIEDKYTVRSFSGWSADMDNVMALARYMIDCQLSKSDSADEFNRLKHSVMTVYSRLSQSSVNSQTLNKIVCDSTSYERYKHFDMEQIGELTFVEFSRLSASVFAQQLKPVFILSGDIDSDKAKALADKYIGTMAQFESASQSPSIDKKIALSGRVEQLTIGTETTDKKSVMILFGIDDELSESDAAAFQILRDEIDYQLNDLERSDSGSFYDIAVTATRDRSNRRTALLLSLNTTDAENVVQRVMSRLKLLANKPMDRDRFITTRANVAALHHSATEILAEREISRLMGIAPTDYHRWFKTASTVTTRQVQNLMERLLTSSTRVTLIANFGSDEKK